MSYLLAISIGPVQDAIAAARRTADLTAGSQLLCHVAMAAAQSVQAAGGDLIFPADSQRDGPNKILAEMPAGDPAAASLLARQAALGALRGAWAAATAAPGFPIGLLDGDVADRQVDQFLEFYAAWWPLADGYPEARTQVERLLAGRKALRDFEPPPSCVGRPKSPLDPSRDCAIRTVHGQGMPPECKRPPLHLKARESLDAISLLKRAWPSVANRSPVPSTSLMALRSILPALEAESSAELAELRSMAAGCGAGVDLGDLFFPGRLDETEEEGYEIDRARADDLRHAALKAIHRSEPSPYFAVLVADGDRMGKAISAQRSKVDHQRLSAALVEFAEAVVGIVPRHDGYPVYAGGDDVMALLPANRCLACAENLATVFRSRLADFESDGGAPSLSVGIAIVHHLESLQVSLDRARAALRKAKEPRDALAVALHTRSGAPITTYNTWLGEDKPEWNRWARAFRQGLSHGLPYELWKLARELTGLDLNAEQVRAEAGRIINRKQEGSGRASATETLPDWARDAATLERFALQLVISRFLANLPEVA